MSIFAVNGKSPIAVWCPSRDVLGNGTATLTDLVGSNNGTLTNMDAATDWVSDTGAGGVRALDFDGIDDSVITSTNDTTVHNLSFWVKSGTQSAGGSSIIRPFVSKGNVGAGNAGLSVGTNRDTSSVIRWQVGTTEVVVDAASINDGNWHHLAIVSESGTSSLYFDGAVISTLSTGTIASGVYRLGGSGTLNRFAACRLDDFRIFSQALDASDVAYLYNSGNGRGRLNTSYDTDAATYIAAVEEADGQSLETGVKNAINSFVVGCKSDGIWTAIKAACIMAGARTLNGALVPLVGPAPTNFNFVSGDYNRETGLVGNGSTKYLNSNRNTTSDPVANHHLAVWTASPHNPSTATAYYVGGVNASFVGHHIGVASSNHTYRSWSSSTTNLPSANSVGFFGVRRDNSSNFQWRGAGNDGTTTSSTSSISTAITVFARNVGTVPAAYTNARLSWYSIGESLDLALLDARLSTVMTALANPATYGSPYRRNNFFISNMF